MTPAEGEQHPDKKGKTSCKPTQDHSVSPAALELKGHWAPENVQLINKRLQPTLGANQIVEYVAIFDFDNTCIYRDVGKAVFRHQLHQLRYKISPDQLTELFPPGIDYLDGKPLQAVIDSILSAYKKLWPLISSNQQEQARELREYEIFTALILWFADRARKEKRLGPQYALPFLTKLLAGHSIEELYQLTSEVLTTTTQEPLTTVQVETTLPEPIGKIRASYDNGLQVQPEMISLILALQQRGIKCYVVSASTEWLVEAAVKHLGFNLPKENIFGIRVELDGDNILTTADVDHYPVTFRQGKAEVIKRHIKGRPIFVAGDADTDYEMLLLPEVAIRLIINHNTTGLISSLYEDPRFILQGIDTATGRFRPHRETITTK